MTDTQPPPIEEHYAVIADDVVINVIVCDDPDYAAEQPDWICLEGLDPMPWIGWVKGPEGWTPPAAEKDDTG